MENEIIEADYQVIPERTPETIRAEIKTIEAQVYNTTLNGCIEIGRRLSELKEMLGHGNWLPWCKEQLGYSDRQARRYMEISENYGDENSPFSNWTTSSNLSISKAYSLLSVPEEEVEEFVENHDVENVTVKELNAQIEEWKRKNESLQTALDNTEVEKEELQNRIDTAESRSDELVSEIGKLKEKQSDPAEIEKLQAQLDKEKEKLKKAKEDLKKEKDSQEQALQEALEEKKAEMQKEAEAVQAEKLEAAAHREQEAREQVATLEKKLQLSQNEDAEQAAKLKKAARTVLQSMMGRLGV